jgi:hypothetical protein
MLSELSFLSGLKSLSETICPELKAKDSFSSHQLRSTYFARLPTKNICARYRPLDPTTNDCKEPQGKADSKSVDRRLTFEIARVFGAIYDAGDLVRAKTLEYSMKGAMDLKQEGNETVSSMILLLLLLSDTSTIENKPFDMYVSQLI